ncbi:MAG: hypothetical protein H8E44_16815 [Planctomycetes bacterium]|nr:hypothetical protein [Planctomycetota bacterium]MBL7038397.1 hypothetical protein [Pirellulaceae bacterium]
MTTPAGSGRHLLDSELSGRVLSSVVAYWDFDDMTAHDQVHSGVNGALVGDTKIVRVAGEKPVGFVHLTVQLVITTAA